MRDIVFVNWPDIAWLEQRQGNRVACQCQELDHECLVVAEHRHHRTRVSFQQTFVRKVASECNHVELLNHCDLLPTGYALTSRAAPSVRRSQTARIVATRPEGDGIGPSVTMIRP